MPRVVKEDTILPIYMYDRLNATQWLCSSSTGVHAMYNILQSDSICLFTGEFGVVYKAHLVKTISNGPLHSRTITETIAVKTLKGESVFT